jgi:2-amino-4-hydroxy-6-hydroxymethyldihydropteridine diphosphokinase
MACAYLLVGTNLGDLRSNIEKALENMQHKGIVIAKKSRISRTKPWGNTQQPDFFNMVLEINTDYDPMTLLQTIKSIEEELGRTLTGVRWGPRVIDIDILFYEDRVINTRDLVVPHREFLNRPFAIQLMADVAPEFIHPCTHKPVREYAGSSA